jgi:hypothetical protein
MSVPSEHDFPEIADAVGTGGDVPRDARVSFHQANVRGVEADLDDALIAAG